MASNLLSKIDEHFEDVTDPRQNRGGNDPLLEMVFVALYATICDDNTCAGSSRTGAENGSQPMEAIARKTTSDRM